MLQVPQKLNLPLQSRHHASFLFLILHAHAQVDLLDSHQQATMGVHAEVHLAKGTCANERSLDPFDRACV
jgi:hypothetical protein